MEQNVNLFEYEENLTNISQCFDTLFAMIFLLSSHDQKDIPCELLGNSFSVIVENLYNEMEKFIQSLSSDTAHLFGSCYFSKKDDCNA